MLSTLADYALGKTQYSPGKGGVVAAVMIGIVAVLGVIWLRRWRRDRSGVDRHIRGASLAFMGAWMGGGIVALYLASVTPGHAMGARYLAAAWPFFAAVPILLFRSAGSYRMPLAALLVAVTLTAGITSARRVDQANAALPYPDVLADDQRAVLLDTDRRGLLAPALWRIPARRTVLAASQHDLLAHTRRWLARLNGRRVAYVSASTLGGTSAGRQRIRRRITNSGRRSAPPVASRYGTPATWLAPPPNASTRFRAPHPRASRDANSDTVH